MVSQSTEFNSVGNWKELSINPPGGYLILATEMNSMILTIMYAETHKFFLFDLNSKVWHEVDGCIFQNENSDNFVSLNGNKKDKIVLALRDSSRQLYAILSYRFFFNYKWECQLISSKFLPHNYALGPKTSFSLQIRETR